jgi:hypothetical protein
METSIAGRVAILNVGISLLEILSLKIEEGAVTLGRRRG